MGIVWIIEGIVSLTALTHAWSRVLTVVYMLLAIVAGIILIVSPLGGSATLWWLLGISLVVLGGVQIVRAATFTSE